VKHVVAAVHGERQRAGARQIADGDLDDDPYEVDAGDDDEPADANGKLDEFPRSAKAPRPDDAEEAA